MRTRLLSAVVLLSAILSGQALRNFSLDETDGNTGAIVGWQTPPNVGWNVAKYQTSGCRTGAGCASLPSGAGERSNLMQRFDAAPFRGKLVRMRAWLHTEGNARAQMWFRVDLPENKLGFFDNMQERPVVGAADWRSVEISGAVAENATAIALGVMAFDGPVVFDDVSLEIIGDAPKPLPVEPARPLGEPGLRNLTTFSAIYGLVRYYHPGDEVTASNMDRLAIEALPAIEAANTPEKLAAALRAVFLPVAPTIRIWHDGVEPPAALARSPAATQVVNWKHHGVGLTSPSVYASTREKSPATPETKSTLR